MTAVVNEQKPTSLHCFQPQLAHFTSLNRAYEYVIPMAARAIVPVLSRTLKKGTRVGGPNVLARAFAVVTSREAAANAVDEKSGNVLVKTGALPRVVVLGTGWGCYAAAKALDPDAFDVHVVRYGGAVTARRRAGF